jgi:hypothetical protein
MVTWMGMDFVCFENCPFFCCCQQHDRARYRYLVCGAQGRAVEVGRGALLASWNEVRNLQGKGERDEGSRLNVDRGVKKCGAGFVMRRKPVEFGDQLGAGVGQHNEMMVIGEELEGIADEGGLEWEL